jgi:hypothetical protein
LRDEIERSRLAEAFGFDQITKHLEGLNLHRISISISNDASRRHFQK